jgi:outer membrane protein OmpA-like peptidoglycan-associated protein
MGIRTRGISMGSFLILPLIIYCLLQFPAYAGASAGLVPEDCPKAVELYNKGTLSKDPGEKEMLFRETIPLCTDPEVISKVFNNLADAYETKGDFTKAIINYRKAIAVKKDFITPYVGVGDIFAKLGDYYSAYVMYGNALRIDPEDKDAIQGRKKAEEAYKNKMVLYFDRDSSTISDNYIYRIQAIAEYAKSSKRINVTGFTCDIGSKAYNKRLSMKRAQSVASYFKSHYPTDSKRFVVKGKGKSEPLLPDSSEEAQTLNRRVEVMIE